MSEKRRGLGRGIGALIPPASAASERASAPDTVDEPTPDREAADRQPTAARRRADPMDVFFPDADRGARARGATRDRGPAPARRSYADVSRETAAPTAEPVDTSGRGQPPARTSRQTSAVSAAAVMDDVSRETQSENPIRRDAAAAPGSDDSALVAVPGAEFAEVPVRSVRPNTRQPRQIFEPDALAELVVSIREVGVLQPIVVRRVAEDASGASYELIMGERRWRASQEAGLEVVPAIIRDTEDDHMLRDALLENLHRSDLNPLEEASAYQQLLDDFGCTQDELSQRIGRSRPQISNTLRLLRLAPGVQRRVAAGVLSAGHARALLAVDDPAAAERLATRIVAEGLSVRAVEEIVASGGTGRRPSRIATRGGARRPELDTVANRLSDRLDTRVSVALGKNRGRLTVEFATVADLDRILSVLDPGGPGVEQAATTTD